MSFSSKCFHKPAALDGSAISAKGDAKLLIGHVADPLLPGFEKNFVLVERSANFITNLGREIFILKTIGTRDGPEIMRGCACFRRYEVEHAPLACKPFRTGFVFNTSCGLCTIFNDAEARRQVTQVHPHGRFKADSAVAIAEATAAGIGIAAQPDVIGEPYVAAGRLEAIMTGWSLPSAGILVVRPPGQHLARKVRVLTELLLERFGHD